MINVLSVTVVLTTLEVAKQGSQPIQETSTVYTPEKWGTIRDSHGLQPETRYGQSWAGDVESHSPWWLLQALGLRMAFQTWPES